MICEKPLGRDAAESYDAWKRVAAAGVKHMCAFNYRFVPAVRLARQLIEAGDLGEITTSAARYLQEWGLTSTTRSGASTRHSPGSGALGDLGAHVIDLARYLVGEVKSVAGTTATFKPGRDVDDAFESAVAFDNGAVGTIEATRFATGRKNALTLEINGSKGSIAFDLERLNELQVHIAGSTPAESAQGFRTVLVSEADHPFWEWWWPHGHIIGWEHSFVHELHHLLTAIREDARRGPARRHVRGRVPLRRGLRRDPALRRERQPRGGRLQRLSRPAPAPRRGPRRADPPIRPGFTRHERVKSGRTGCPPPGGRNTLAAPRWRDPG